MLPKDAIPRFIAEATDILETKYLDGAPSIGKQRTAIVFAA